MLDGREAPRSHSPPCRQYAERVLGFDQPAVTEAGACNDVGHAVARLA
jgi:hypothetical protein